MLKRALLGLALIIGAPLSILAQAEGETYEAGVDYDLITPAIRTQDPGKVEITEFFWYGCGHCYTFEPMIGNWKKNLPERAYLRGSPAIWNGPMELHAKAFYAAQALGVMDTMHMALFQAMNVDRKRLGSESEVAALFAANGVDEEAFTKAFSSFGVESQTRQANSRARAAKITGTPEIMVNGKYRITSRKAGSQANMLKVADYLIAQEVAALAQ